MADGKSTTLALREFDSLYMPLAYRGTIALAKIGASQLLFAFVAKSIVTAMSCRLAPREIVVRWIGARFWILV